MGQWHKTGCVLCAQNCGLEIFVKNNKMLKVKGDRDNPRSKGYACRKGLNVIYHQYPKDRLREPLKKINGKFEPISWKQAFDEIGEKLKTTINTYGPRSFAYLGGSAQGGHMEATFGISLLRTLGSQYFYSSAGQEFSGIFWTLGRMFGKQYCICAPDEHNTEMLIAWGWNGMVSHQMPRAPIVLREISKDPKRLLVSIDPRKSETAEISNIHFAIRPGTDALLIKAIIAIIIENGWEAKKYIEDKTNGWETIRPCFEKFNYKSAIELCELQFDQVYDFCKLLTTKKWSMHPDLGIYMGRHSTLNSYLMNILGAICGRFGEVGGNIFPGMIVPLGFHADEQNPRVWKTVKTKMPPAAAGSFPPSVIPEEILNDNPERLRAIIASAVNPLRSWPDTSAYEKAFEALDLLVVNDIVMSETARFADYVLPCRTFYESYDGTFFPLTFPEVYFQLRTPIVKPETECYEASQIFTEIADRVGLIPEIPEEVQKAAASGNRMAFGAQLMQWAGKNPEYLKKMPFIAAKTLGKEWDSAALAALWLILMTAPGAFKKNAQRAGFEPGLDMGDKIFQSILENPQGLWIGKTDTDDNFSSIKTDSGKIELYIPELAEIGKNLDAESEQKDLQLKEDYPFILNAGRHMETNINTLMRNPAWNKGLRACTVAVNPNDAKRLAIQDNETVRVITEGGSVMGELEISNQIRKGTVLIPHGFGLIYDGKMSGINVNRLTKNTHRDPLGTPLHRYVPCRLEKIKD